MSWSSPQGSSMSVGEMMSSLTVGTTCRRIGQSGLSRSMSETKCGVAATANFLHAMVSPSASSPLRFRTDWKSSSVRRRWANCQRQSSHCSGVALKGCRPTRRGEGAASAARAGDGASMTATTSGRAAAPGGSAVSSGADVPSALSSSLPDCSLLNLCEEVSIMRLLKNPRARGARKRFSRARPDADHTADRRRVDRLRPRPCGHCE